MSFQGYSIIEVLEGCELLVVVFGDRRRVGNKVQSILDDIMSIIKMSDGRGAERWLDVRDRMQR